MTNSHDRIDSINKMILSVCVNIGVYDLYHNFAASHRHWLSRTTSNCPKMHCLYEWMSYTTSQRLTRFDSIDYCYTMNRLLQMLYWSKWKWLIYFRKKKFWKIRPHFTITKWKFMTKKRQNSRAATPTTCALILWPLKIIFPNLTSFASTSLLIIFAVKLPTFPTNSEAHFK